MNPPTQGGLGVWFYVITWALVISGWIIVNWQNNRREDRKEIRSALNQIYADIDALQKKSIKYHKSSERNLKAEAKINIMNRRLSEHLGHLGLRLSSYSEEYAQFIDSITMENFETTTFTQQKEGDLILDRIRDNSSYLESALENEFSSLFRGGATDKLLASFRHLREKASPLGKLVSFIDRRQEGIITFIAYVFFVLFIGYVTSLVPPQKAQPKEAHAGRDTRASSL